MQLLLLSLGLGALSKLPGIQAGSTVAFIPTAGHPYTDPVFVDSDRRRLSALGYAVTEADPTSQAPEAVRDTLNIADWIFVAGGNTFYLMQEIRRTSVDRELVNLIRMGKPYVGASAGAVIVGPSLEPVLELDDRGKAPDLTSLDGLAITSVVVLPHYGKEKYLAKYERIIRTYSKQYDLIPLCDDEAVLVRDGGSVQKMPSEIILPEV